MPFNTLTCVNRYNASRPLDVYRFLRRELGSTYLQFIPIVEIKGFETTAPQKWDPARLPVVGTPQAKPDHPDSVVTPWSVDPDEYGYFLSKVWDEWLARDYGKVLVSFCETLVVQHMGMPAQNCIQSEFCGKGVAIEHDGSVYACDHYVYPEYRLGNVRERIARRHGVLADAGEVRLRQVRDAARVLQAMRIPARLLGRVPEEPAAAHAGRRAGPQLSLPGSQAVLRACGADRGEAGGAVAGGAGDASAIGCNAVTRRISTATWLLQVMLADCACTAGSAQAADEEARVLILNGTDPYLPAYLAIDSAMRASLAEEPGRRVVYFSEPLDAQRFQVEAYEPELTALLAKKYSGLRFDVVVAVSQRALEFFNRHGALLWPGARLVFSGWPGEVFESSSGLPPDAAAVVADVDVGETIDLARRLQPNARRIVMVSGASDLDRRNERTARQVRRTARRLSFEFLTGLPLPELVSRLAAEPADYDRRLHGTVSRPRGPTVHAARGPACNQRPVHGPRVRHGRNRTLGFGMVAGLAESYEEHGKLVGQLIREALAGRSPAAERSLCSMCRAGALPTPARCSAGRWTSGACRTAAKSALPTTATGVNIGGRSSRRWQSSSGRAC